MEQLQPDRLVHDGLRCAREGAFQGPDVDARPSDLRERQLRREEREVVPIEDDEHGPAARQPVVDDASHQLVVRLALLHEDGVDVVQVRERGRDVRACQVRAHQHDRVVREHPRHPGALRERVVP